MSTWMWFRALLIWMSSSLFCCSAALAQQSVNLAPVSALYGIGTLNSPVPGGGLDGAGSAYASNLLGTGVNWGGSNFVFNAAGPNSAATSTTVTLPTGKFQSLSLLAAGVQRNQVNQAFVVTYSDGSKTTLTQSLSNWNTPQHYAGEAIVLTTSYKLTATGASHAGAYNVYGYTFPLDVTKTVKSFTLPGNAHVVVLAIDVTAPPVKPISVSLKAVDNLYGIGVPNTAVTGGGIDRSGGAYASNLLGSSVSWAGATFSFGTAGATSAITGNVIPVPAGMYKTISILATAVNRNQPNQTFVARYSDGTTTTFTQSLSNWNTPQYYPGESIVLTTAYKLTATGATKAGAYNVYGYSFAVNSGKTLQSLSLPANNNVVLLALDLTPASGTAPPVAATPTFSLASGTYGTPFPVTLADTTPGAKIYYTIDGSTPSATNGSLYTGSALSFGDGNIFPLTLKAIAIATGFSNSAVATAVYRSATPPTVHLTATATDPNGFQLTYQWRTTDGTLSNVQNNQADWLLPRGPGLHLAYVMVSNQSGGYAEGHIAVTTDDIGAPLVVQAGDPTKYSAPSAPAPALDTAPRRFFVTNSTNDFSSPTPANVATPGVSVFLYDSTRKIYLSTNPNCTTTSPPSAGPPPAACGLLTDDKGAVAFQNVTTTDTLISTCGISPYLSAPCTPAPAAPFSTSGPSISAGPSVSQIGVPSVSGTILQQNGSLLGEIEPFFGVNAPVMAQLSVPFCTGDFTQCSSTALVNEYGDFAVPLPLATAANQNLYLYFLDGTTGSLIQVFSTYILDPTYGGPKVGTLNLSYTTSPTINSVSATYGGSAQLNGASIVSLALDPPNQPSDTISQADRFLSFKGSDTRSGACRYYQAIGAVPPSGCASDGTFANAVTFSDWQAAVGISPLKTGAVSASATYVNAVDLNLTRVHQSVAYPATPYGTNSYPVAAYVCNHLGPRDSAGNKVTVNLPVSTMTTAQIQAVDTAVNRAVNNKDELACVAMDYQSSNANGGKPFTRFLIFGPDGHLLPSVNLDGRGEKFVPGACIACHGGDKYAGKYPEDGSGFADVGAHFLPYDVGNFAFSSQAPLRSIDQETAIYQLNQNILGTSPTSATRNLVAGWYQTNNGPPQDQNYVPGFWFSYPELYKTVIARSCRTCHAVLPENLDNNHPQGYTVDYSQLYCGGSANRMIDHSMPNSLVTFNRFWNSRGAQDSSGNSTDQPALLAQFINYNNGFQLSGGCLLNQGP